MGSKTEEEMKRVGAGEGGGYTAYDYYRPRAYI